MKRNQKSKRKHRSELSPIDVTILQLCNIVKRDKCNIKEYKELEHLLSPIVVRTLNDYWGKVPGVTIEEILSEIIYDILYEFIPKFDMTKGRLLSFIKMKVRSRIKKRWTRETYINADITEKRIPKKNVLKNLDLNTYNGSLDAETLATLLKNIAKKVLKEEMPMSLQTRKLFFNLVHKSQLYKQILAEGPQRNVFERYYSEIPQVEKDIALALGITQQTVNTTKKRAERNIIKKLPNISIL